MLSTNKVKGKEAFIAVKSSYPENLNSKSSSLCRLYIHDLSDIHEAKKFTNELKGDLKSLNDRLSFVVFQSEAMQDAWIENPDYQIQPDFSSHVLSLYCIISNLIEYRLLQQSKEELSSKNRVIVIGNPALLRRPLLYSALEGNNWKRSFKPGRAYANYKREQMEMMVSFASSHPDILFYCVNPGLINHPSLKYLAHSTFKSTKNKCRTIEQAADGVIWACTAPSIEKTIPSGNLILDRKRSSAYLPFSSTQPTSSQRKKFITRLEDFKRKLYEEVPDRPSIGTISNKSSQLVAPESDNVYNNPELPSYSDTENKN